MCDPVRTMFSIRQDVHTKFNRPDVNLHGPDDEASYMEIACTSSTLRMSAFMVRTIKLHIWKLCAPVQPSRRPSSWSGRSKPYYGNYVQLKCNCPDTRATPSRLGLVMKAFSAILERRLQLTVWTLGQAIWTPSGILVIIFYSNIGLGRNWLCWKVKKKLCNLSVWTAINSIQTDLVRTAL